MTCTICDIINNPTLGFIVYEDDAFICFLDNKPLFEGHCLISPKMHIAEFEKLPNDLLLPLMQKLQLISSAVRNSLNAEGTFVALNNNVSQSIPHMHFHIVPRRKGDGLKGFFWPRQKYINDEHIREVQNKIIKYLDKSFVKR